MLSSLNVKVVNNKTKIDIDTYIFLDDSIQKIKDKLFIHSADYVPNFLKIEVGESRRIVSNSNDILYEYVDDLENPVIYISNIQDNLVKNPEDLLKDSDLFDSVLFDFQKEYTDLTYDDLQFVIKFVILNKEYTIIKIEYSDIEGYIYNLKEIRDKLLKKAKDMDNDMSIQEFNKLSRNFDFNILENIVSYNNINLNVIGENFENGSKGIFIKLNEIYNIIELNSKIPFIALGRKSGSSRLPQIKLFNKLIDTVQEKEIKSWVLNEKKKLNEATYKIVKGLMIKTQFGINNFLTINILANGLLSVNLKLSQNEQQKYTSLEELINDIKKHVNDIIEYLNTFNGVFLKSKRISLIENSFVAIDSIDTSFETSVFIDRIKFESIIKNQYISNGILELKQTESLDVLSAYYKKFKTRDTLEDTKGITINVKDNAYKEDSSIIKIFGANNYIQTLLILLNILIIAEMSSLLKSDGLFDDFIKKRKIREKTNKKKLKEQGINFDSRECQAIRQPTLHDTPSKDSYFITHNNKNYKCDNSEYPHPGFTKSNIVCCFKYNQSGNESYIKNVNPDSLTILVEPSNFKITITENRKSFETYIIRIVSDYQDGFNESNSMPRYYYLSPLKSKVQLSQADLIPIYNKSLIKQIENEDNIWLDRVPLAQIIYPSATNKCSHKPDLNNRTSINAPCNEYKKEEFNFFGYTSKSIPCCFDKEKDPYISRKKKESDITKQYIIQSSDKILNYQKIGILPEDISVLLNKILIQSDTKTFYRMGVIQNNSSFLNAILLGVNSTINQTLINNHIEFKYKIVKYLQKNPNEFNKLNNGDISIKYSLEEYIEFIMNDNNYLSWNLLIDILERLLKRNIIIFDTNNIETKLLCRQIILNPKKFNRPFILLLKHKNTFELVIQLVLHTDKKNDVIREFQYENKIIKFLTEYYKDTCIKESIYPKNYPYIPINTHQYIIQTLSLQNNNTLLGSIKYQIKNNFNKINYLMTKRGVTIPIIETGIIDNPNIKVIEFSSFIRQNSKLLSLNNYINAFKAYNKITNEIVKIIGIVDTNITEIGGLMSNFGNFIPYLKSDVDDNNDIPKLDFKYYLDIDEKIQENNTTLMKNDFEIYSSNDDKIKTDIFNLKTILGNKIYQSQNIKEDIEDIIKNKTLTRDQKINNILDIFKDIQLIKQEINKDPNTQTLLKSIANEMINDNIENLVLNNIITSDNFNKNDVKIRSSESILLNIDDIRRWIKNFKSNDV